MLKITVYALPLMCPYWRSIVQTFSTRSRTSSMTSCLVLSCEGSHGSLDTCSSWEMSEGTEKCSSFARKMTGFSVAYNTPKWLSLHATHTKVVRVLLVRRESGYLDEFWMVHEAVGFTWYRHHVLWEKVLVWWGEDQALLNQALCRIS